MGQGKQRKAIAESMKNLFFYNKEVFILQKSFFEEMVVTKPEKKGKKHHGKRL